MKKSQNDSEPAGEQMALFSLAGFRSDHAKDLVSQEIDLEQKMTGISGRNISEQLTRSTPIGLLAKMLLESSVWKINPAFTGMYSLKWTIVKLPAFQKLTTMRQYTHDKLNCSSEVSVKVLKKEDMKSKRLLFRLQVLVRRTKGNVSGLSPTITNSMVTYQDFEQAKFHSSKRPKYSEVMLPTPTASSGGANHNSDTVKHGRHGINRKGAIEKAQTLLPTPTQDSAMVVADVDMEKLDERRKKAKDKGINGNGFGPSLNELAVKGMLPTPMSRDYRSPDKPESANFQRKKEQGWTIDLNSFVGMMNTPSAQDAKNSTLPESQLNLDSVVGDILKTGATGQLNPQFVLEMMGFPNDWTLLPFLSGEMKVSKEPEMP